MRVWVTRAEPDAHRTAEALRAVGHQPLVWPLLRVQSLPAGLELTASLEGVAALAFTSAAGVRAFAGLRPTERDWPVFTVGEATARAARAAGFVDVISGHGDSAALAHVIAGHATRPQGAVLHPGARDLAGDLAGALHALGLPARTVALYETLPEPLSAELIDALDANPPSLDAVLIHSAKAARLLAEVLTPRPALTAILTLAALSEAAAAPLAGLAFARRRIAQTPTEPALLATLES